MRSHPAIKPVAWGVVIGAVGMAAIGFWGLGWTLRGSAERMATSRAEAAVVDALTPICVARFRTQADAPAMLRELSKISTSWDRRSFIEKGGWATVPGSTAPNSDVATACAETLGKPA
jgi:hypothetical protein